MASLRKERAFLMLVVLLFSVGHSHRVLGRFQPHHHEAAVVAHHHHDHDNSDHHPSDQDQQKDSDHMAEHTAVVAIVVSGLVPSLGELHVIGSLRDVAVDEAEPRPVSIDHPPQLIG